MKQNSITVEYENLSKVNKVLFEKYETSFSKFIQSGWYVLGENVKTFEKEFADYCNTDYCIGVGSGLDALILAISALDFPKGSEIIVPSNTYVATIMAIIRNGHIPILVEPNIITYNIDPSKIEQHISVKTKAILVVHLYGKSCDMDPIMILSKEYGLAVIEDCAQAHGAMYKGKKVGSFGIGCFSFYPTKNLGALGDAGAITTSDYQYADKIRSLRNYGSQKKYYNDYLGYNSRMDEVQAGFLSIKLKILNDIIDHKQSLAALYSQNLDSRYIKPVQDEKYFDVYHIYNIRLKKRDDLRAYLLENSVKTEIHYPIAPHKQKAIQPYMEDNQYPISEDIHATTLSLPISYCHSKEDILYVIEKLNDFS